MALHLNLLSNNHCAHPPGVPGKKMNPFWSFLVNVRELPGERIANLLNRGWGKADDPISSEVGFCAVQVDGGQSKHYAKAGVQQKSDERMLGDGDFVEDVLSRANERLDRKYLLASKGIDFDQLAQWVWELTGISLS